MKKIFYIFSLLFLFQFSVQSQINIDWKQVASPDSSYRKFRYMSKGGDLYYVDKYTNKTYASFDYGKTWELLIIPFIQGAPNPFNPFNVKPIEDADGNLYFAVPKYFKTQSGYGSNSSLLYKFDRKTKITDLWYDLQPNSNVQDFTFINGKEVILTTSKKILLFDVDQRKIKKEILATMNDGTIFHSPGFKTYIKLNYDGSNSTFQGINDTLGLVGNKIFSQLDDAVYYAKGRFFSPYFSKYTDDEGKTWNKLNNFQFQIITFEIGHNGYIFGEKDNNYLISKDNGDSFEILSVYDNHWITSDTAGVLLKTMKSYCRDPKISYISHDGGKHWEEIRPNLNSKPHAQSVYAGLNGNLIANNNCELVYCYSDDEKNWKKPLNKFNKVFYPSPVVELPDGSLFVSENLNYYNINADFDSLTACNFNFYSPSERKVKNNKLFINVNNEIVVSEDFINIKEKYSYKEFGVNGFIASNYRLLQRINNGSFGWRIIDLKTKIITPLQIPNSIQTIETSYAGNNIYALEYTSSGVSNHYDYYIHQSNDGGLSFAKILVAKNIESDLLSMHVDHNENIYLLFEDKLFVSIDEGHTWFDITPKSPDLIRLTGLSISFDNYIYLSTLGLGIIRTEALNSQNVKYLHVSAKRDVNFNCVKDLEDSSKIYGVVRLSNGYEKPLNKNGEALVYLFNDTTYAYLDINPYGQVCQNNIQVFSDGPDSLLFLVKANECDDLKLGLSTSILRRCFDNTYEGFIKNEGTFVSEISTLNVTLDTFFDFVSSNLEVLSYNHPEVKLAIPEIEVGTSLKFEMKINLNCEALFGQEHCIYADIDSRNPCFGESRSIYSECRNNVGSYDPNDKAIFVAGKKDESYIKPDDKIEYLIRFQNTGTDTAFTVKIEDNINSKFDLSSLRPIAASHEFDWEIKPDRRLVVYFNNIMLVDSFKNEPGSHGFVKFEIKLDTNEIMLGDTITNTANIFFDFNEAVTTNTVFTINGSPTNIEEITNTASFILYPNPTNSLINIRKTDQISGTWNVIVFNSSGQPLHKEKFNTFEGSIDLKELYSGFYIIKIISGNSTIDYKVIKL